MIAQSDSPEDILDKFKTARLHAWAEKEKNAQEQRERLRDMKVQLREPSHTPAIAPASTTQPTFKIGPVKGFPFVAEPGATPEKGNLSADSADAFNSFMKEAASKPDAASRDASVDKAANVVAKDWAAKHGVSDKHDKHGMLTTALHEGRAQAAFASREIGKQLGLGPVESTIIGYSLERALEKQGFKVIANHAIDATASAFKATASSVATAAGMRNAADTTLNKSLTWLASNGVTREGLKESLGKHAGKLTILMEASQHPEVIQRTAFVLSKSDSLLEGVLKLSKDAELRKSVGTLALAAGETVAGANKAVGSTMIVAGSVMRGDTSEETARHAFRAALSIMGGAAGGLAGGGVLSLGTGTLGAMAGAKLADKLLEVYDKHTGHDPNRQVHTVSHQDVVASSKVIAERTTQRLLDTSRPLPGSEKLAAAMHDRGVALPSHEKASALLERGKELEREYSMSKPLSNKG